MVDEKQVPTILSQPTSDERTSVLIQTAVVLSDSLQLARQMRELARRLSSAELASQADAMDSMANVVIDRLISGPPVGRA